MLHHLRLGHPRFRQNKGLIVSRLEKLREILRLELRTELFLGLTDLLQELLQNFRARQACRRLSLLRLLARLDEIEDLL